MFRRFGIIGVALSATFGGLADAAQAQAVRYVASFGSDGSNCTREAPCRTLQRGIDRTPDGGELQLLDSGAYGNAATIARSITISGDGVSATVGNIVMDAPGARVVLRGLMLNGRNVPANTGGIRISNAAAVHIVGCEVAGFTGNGSGHGIRVDAENAAVFVSRTTVRNNQDNGLLLTIFATGSRLAVENSRFVNNGGDGIRLAASADAAISRVIASGNKGTGISIGSGRTTVTRSMVANNGIDGFAIAGVGPGGQLTLNGSVAAGNSARGLFVSDGATPSAARMTDSAFFGSGGVDVRNNGSTIYTRGNNAAGTTSGVLTPLPSM